MGLPDDDDEMRNALAAAKTRKEVAARYGVSEAAVSQRAKRLVGAARPVGTEAGDIIASIWDVRTWRGAGSHQLANESQRLRLYMRWRLGDQKLEGKGLSKARAYPALMQDKVLVYDREDERPWSYRPRRPEDGLLVVEIPEGLPRPEGRALMALSLPGLDHERSS